MNLLKVILIGIVVVILAFTGLALVGVAISILRYLFWLIVIALGAMLMWKMFGPQDLRQVEGTDSQNKLQNTELTLEEYKRKIEAQLRGDSEK